MPHPWTNRPGASRAPSDFERRGAIRLPSIPWHFSAVRMSWSAAWLLTKV